jgi:hypothetical protein
MSATDRTAQASPTSPQLRPPRTRGHGSAHWQFPQFPPPAGEAAARPCTMARGRPQVAGGGESTAAGRVAGAGAQEIPQMASLLCLPSPLSPSKPLLRPQLPPARPSASESRGQARYESVKVGHCFISC